MHWRLIPLLSSLACGTALAAGLTFDDALRLAEANAPDLQADAARLEGAREAVTAAGALPDPRALAGIENLPIEGPDRLRLQRDGMTMQKLGVMQEFPNARKREARSRAARGEVGLAEAGLAQARIAVRQEAAAAWLSRYYLGRQQAVLRELVKDNRLLQVAVDEQVRAGRRPAADALMPRQEALELANQADDLDRDTLRAEAALRRWTGEPGPVDALGEAPDLPFTPDAWRQHLPHHPDLLRFRPEQEVAEAELDEANASLRPDWGIEVDYQHRGDAFGDMVSVEVSADLPLFSRTRQTPRIRAREQALRRLEAGQEAMRREHAAALESDIGTLVSLSRQRDRLRLEALPLAARRVELQLAGYRSGTTALTDVLEARRELHALQLKSLALEADYGILLARTHYLIDSGEVQP